MHGNCIIHVSQFMSVLCSCPLDPHHQVKFGNQGNELRKHLAVCTTTRDVAFEVLQPFYKENCNGQQLSATVGSTHFGSLCQAPEPTSVSNPPLCHQIPERGRWLTWKKWCELDRADPGKAGAFGAAVKSSCDDSREIGIESRVTGAEYSEDAFRFCILEKEIDRIYREACRCVSIEPEHFLEGFGNDFTGDSSPNGFLEQELSMKFEKNFVEAWKSSSPNNSIDFRRCVHACMTELVKKRSATLASGREILPTSSSEAPNGPMDKNPEAAITQSIKCSVPAMQKHEIQNSSLLALALPYLNDIDRSFACIEYGAGRGALTRWFLTGAQQSDGLRLKCLLLDREKRRFIQEEKNEQLILDTRKRDRIVIRTIRLRLDIRDFDFAAFAHFLIGRLGNPSTFPENGSTPSMQTWYQSEPDTIVGLQAWPRLCRYLHLFGAYPLRKLRVQRLTRESNETQEKNVTAQNDVARPAAALSSEPKDMNEGNSRDLSVPRWVLRSELIDDLVKFVGKQNFQRLETLRNNIFRCFNEDWVGQRRTTSLPRKLGILSIAKHLCGNATDAALASVTTNLTPSADVHMKLYICIAPCCHHRCTWDALQGKALLEKLGIASEKQFEELKYLTGWATGTTGPKQILGVKLKRIIDIARVWYLRKQCGFLDAQLVKFVSPDVSPENAVIVGSKQVQ